MSNPKPHASLFGELGEAILDLVYPPRCLVCGTLGRHVLCPACIQGFHPVKSPICQNCGRPRARGEKCPDCTHAPARYITQARAPWIFDGTLREAVHALKYRRKRRLAQPLGQTLADFLLTKPFPSVVFDAVVPVPLHPKRLRQRGFNQSALLAKEVAQALNLPVAEVLIRTRATRTQVTLHVSERAANVVGAFAVPVPGDVEGRTLLLVDDVVTTLRTADECARVLREAGCAAVYVASLARDL
ncbi:MAG: double zinc ribbon domain-containing protein [Chthonomonadales bacterium]